MDDVWTRLHTNLTRLVRQLDVDEEGKGNRLYDTVFDQALSLTEMLGTCNVTGDTQMEAMKRQLEQALHQSDGAPLTVDKIKKSPPCAKTHAQSSTRLCLLYQVWTCNEGFYRRLTSSPRHIRWGLRLTNHWPRPRILGV